MRSEKVLLIVLSGIAAGILSGIVFATMKGRAIRKRLLTKSKNYSGRLRNISVNLLESVAVKLEKGVNDVFFDENNTVFPEDEVIHDSQII